jgi:hypothetical protein
LTLQCLLSRYGRPVTTCIIPADMKNQIYFSDVMPTTVASGLCKVSILEFYERIFITKGFQRICNVCIFLISAWMIGTFFVSPPIFQSIYCTTANTALRPSFLAQRPSPQHGTQSSNLLTPITIIRLLFWPSSELALYWTFWCYAYHCDLYISYSSSW